MVEGLGAFLSFEVIAYIDVGKSIPPAHLGYRQSNDINPAKQFRPR